MNVPYRILQIMTFQHNVAPPHYGGNINEFQMRKTGIIITVKWGEFIHGNGFRQTKGSVDDLHIFWKFIITGTMIHKNQYCLFTIYSLRFLESNALT